MTSGTCRPREGLAEEKSFEKRLSAAGRFLRTLPKPRVGIQSRQVGGRARRLPLPVGKGQAECKHGSGAVVLL